jgi:hypothetical protein
MPLPVTEEMVVSLLSARNSSLSVDLMVEMVVAVEMSSS